MALRFALKKTCSPLARSGALFHASATAVAAPVTRPISATRHLSTSPCPYAAAAQISCPRTGMPSININRMKSAYVDSSRQAMRTYSSKAIIDDEPSSAAQLLASRASHRNFLKNLRLVACGLSLLWAFNLYLMWSKPRPRRCSCCGRRGYNGRRGHNRRMISGGQTSNPFL